VIAAAVVVVTFAAVGLVAAPNVYSATPYSMAQYRSPRLTVRTPTGGTVTGPRINCPPTCTASFSRNQRVTLTAQPAAGFGFLGWGGACTATGPTCTLRMSGDRAVSAFFGLRPRLTVEEPIGGVVTGPGIDCPPTCTATYEAGQAITLVARPEDPSIIFLNWAGACGGEQVTCTLVMTGDQTVSAFFAFVDPCPPVCGPATVVGRPPGEMS
jgi:Divergent InlB B-repeat domain